MDWKNKFNSLALKKGQEIFEQGNVINLEKTDKGYEAFVREQKGFPVAAYLQDGKLLRMHCNCPTAKGRQACKHMAAMMFAIEESEKKPKETDELDSYNYFQIEKLEKSLNLTVADRKSAQKLINEGKVKLLSVEMGYTAYQEKPVAVVKGDFYYSSYSDRVSLVLSEDEILDRRCEYYRCNIGVYSWQESRKDKCSHIVALFLLTKDYLMEHKIGDATSRTGKSIVYAFQSKRALQTIAGKETEEKSLSIEPRMQKRDGEFSVSFRVGKKDKKMFVIKKLSDFVRQVKNGESVQYGTSTILNHSISNFTEESRKYVSYITEIVDEEETYAEKQNQKRYGYYVSADVGQNVLLWGKRLDNFYRLLGKKQVEYEDKADKNRKKSFLVCKQGNPQIAFSIKPMMKNNVFQGIDVSGNIPEILNGLEAAYYIQEQKWYRIDKDYSEVMEPFFQYGGENMSFQIGRYELQSFYYTILPKLQEYAEIEIHNAQLIEKYLLPEVHFRFYLDAQDQDVTCKVMALYGEKEVSCMDLLEPSQNPLESYRDEYRESEALFTAQQYFPVIDEENQELCCGKSEDAVYYAVHEGVEELMRLGEVHSTDNFQNVKVIRHAAVSVGVALESDLLNLEISSEDLSMEELLEVLKSYQQKKHYHRLKSGSFLALEDDTFEMLSEMMETLQIKPKEFVAGKMQIPAYRALYLEKMMEEHESVYTNRDSHFKKLIKEFKVVSDADFEVPDSLKKTLRGYQKTGYRWIRTLAESRFGGILADDMGLGKTLQVIAVLLALKEEGNLKTSLIICPASLVYNWKEEILRFAPSLSCCLITGKQEERQNKIKEYQKYDVLVTSYDLLKRDIAVYEDADFGYEVIDEAQYIKNHTTAAAKAVKLIHSENRFALTGTPIENRLSELWSIFDYLMPGLLYRYETFKKEFETQIVKYENKEKTERLRKMVNPFILRRLKEDVLKDLPDKLEEVRYVAFEEEQQRLYDAQVVHMKQKIMEQDPKEFQKNKLEILKELTRLRQICCDPSLCFENYNGGSAKLDACVQLVESAIEGGHKILLFSQFTTMLERIKKAFDQRNISYYVITGSTPKEKRISMVNKFNRDQTQVFLISLKAGGTGLNLTGADVVIHYDPWWNIAVQNQATDRAHRIGQAKAVSVYQLIIRKTVEEKIQKLQQSKKNLADQIIGGEVGQMAGLSKEDLLELLG